MAGINKPRNINYSFDPASTREEVSAKKDSPSIWDTICHCFRRPKPSSPSRELPTHIPVNKTAANSSNDTPSDKTASQDSLSDKIKSVFSYILLCFRCCGSRKTQPEQEINQNQPSHEEMTNIVLPPSPQEL
jgi:hypothetical protein